MVGEKRGLAVGRAGHGEHGAAGPDRLAREVVQRRGDGRREVRHPQHADRIAIESVGRIGRVNAKRALVPPISAIEEPRRGG